MYIDYLYSNTPAAHAAAMQKLLEDLHDRFSKHSKDMTNYGLPKPLKLKSELEQEQQLIGTQFSNLQWLQELKIQTPNTEEMNIAYNEITKAIREEKTAFYAIIGIGGAGKTQFAKKVNYAV